jgi:hypothetical protein
LANSIAKVPLSLRRKTDKNKTKLIDSLLTG